jgi:hypothetical protein
MMGVKLLTHPNQTGLNLQDDRQLKVREGARHSSFHKFGLQEQRQRQNLRSGISDSQKLQLSTRTKNTGTKGC